MGEGWEPQGCLNSYDKTSLHSPVWCSLFPSIEFLEDGTAVPCPLNEELLKLVPIEVRHGFLEWLNTGKSEEGRIES